MKKNIVEILLEKIQVFSRRKTFSAINSQKEVEVTKMPSREVAEVTKIPPRKIPTSLPEQLRNEIAQGAAFLYGFETSEAPTLPAGMFYSSHAGTNGENGYITLANGNPEAVSTGTTGGYSIRLPDQIEAAASSHHIAVSIIARASGSDRSRFAIAYSTNEVGNSGWRWFDADAEWSIHTMEYDVPVMKEGRGDFVGILPAGEGNPGTEFYYLAITIS